MTPHQLRHTYGTTLVNAGAFERRYEQSASPFEWSFTRSGLAKLMERLADKPDFRTAA